jgi:helix-turn-helix protein
VPVQHDRVMETSLARTIWHHLETVNAVTYFTRECREAPEELGMQGFWMGYFAMRSAPLGEVSPATIEATFFNFHPDRPRRAIPDAYRYASPQQLLTVRSSAAAASLRRLLGADAVSVATTALPPLRAAIAAAAPSGLPLFAANRDVPPPDDPVAALWQAATTLREHRGDGHVALLTAAGLDGCEALVLFSASETIDPALFQRSRGWSADDWAAAAERLRGRLLLDRDGNLTANGRTLRQHIERDTDALAIRPYRALGDARVEAFLDALRPAAREIAASGEIIFPNPMGLPSVEREP